VLPTPKKDMFRLERKGFMKKLLFSSMILVLMVFALTACRGAEGNEATEPAPVTLADLEEGHPLVPLYNILDRFPQYFDTGLPHVEGTIFRYGIATTSPFVGLFGGAVLWTDSADNIVSTMIGSSRSILGFTPELQFAQHGVAGFSYDVEAATLTLTMQHDVYWHDGVPLTLDDLVFAYEVMANPEARSWRFGENERNIVGIMDFRYGYADYISGLVLSDNNRTLTIHFNDLPPDILFNGIWTDPMPRHQFEGVAAEDMRTSDQVRTNPLGWGPFKFYSMVPGESVHLVRNENFVWGTPYIEQMIIETVHPDLVPSHMAAGTLDFVWTFPTAHYGDHRNPTNFRYVGMPHGGYSYVSFRLGHFDFEESRNVFDAHRPMNNVSLRRAMALAADEDLLSEVVFNGLQTPAGAFMSPLHHFLFDLDLPAPIFGYDPERARQILDEAGFIDVDGDGYREDPNGNQLTINWAFPSGAMEDIITEFYIQAWSDIGIRVELWQGRTHPITFLWDMLDFDDDNEEIHIYSHSWTAGFNPNPSGRWNHNIENPSRYTSPQWDAILDRLTTPAAWDSDYFLDAYHAMQQYLYEQVFFFPTRWNINLLAFNNRVANYDSRTGVPASEFDWHLVRLTASEPHSG
jgi:peptide/nickel transport system substrate-binding protein